MMTFAFKHNGLFGKRPIWCPNEFKRFKWQWYHILMLHCIVRNDSESVDGRLCFDEIKWKNIFLLKMQVDNLKFWQNIARNRPSVEHFYILSFSSFSSVIGNVKICTNFRTPSSLREGAAHRISKNIDSLIKNISKTLQMCFCPKYLE